MQPRLFPTGDSKNLVICVSGVGVTKEFSSIITDTLPDLELIGKSQCFPLYYYEERQKSAPGLFDQGGESDYIRRDGISDWILGQAQKAYGKAVTKEDIFYYVYGFLHSPGYRTAFSNDLKKMLPRLPLVEDPKDFWKFSKAGRALAELHIGYEKVPACKEVTVSGDLSGSGSASEESLRFRVEKMRFPKKDQKDTIIYNSKIIVQNIPPRAYDYIVNGKSAIEWVMERYAITTHKESGIRNDPNDWATEVGNPRYILDLLLSVIEVSLRTVDLVEGLPGVAFGDV
jgi:predicted helicase